MRRRTGGPKSRPWGGVGMCRWLDVLSVDALSKALGLENVVHAAVTEKGWSDRVGQDISRMALYHGEVMNLDGGGLKQRPEE